MKRIVFLLLIIFSSTPTFISCSNDETSSTSSHQTNDDDPGPPTNSIHPEFRRYVNSFIQEMINRGQNVGNIPLSVVFVDEITAPNSSQYCAYGYPNFNGTGEARVEVIDSYNCWGRWSDTERENLIYHELGHALLYKAHFSELFPNGSPKSLMCSQVCVNYRVYNKYQLEQKTYYLNELVASTSAIPSWATEKFYTGTLVEENFDTTTEGWEYEIENDTNNEEPYTFYIDNQHVYSAPNSLGISSLGSSNPEAVGYWYKYFDISDFENCSNLIVRGDIITKNLTNGYLYILIDLIEYDTQNEPLRFGRHYNYIEDGTTNTVLYENFEATAICVPLETQAIKVHFYLQSTSECSVFLDNLEIELYE